METYLPLLGLLAEIYQDVVHDDDDDDGEGRDETKKE